MTDYCSKHQIEYHTQSGNCPLCERESSGSGSPEVPADD